MNEVKIELYLNNSWVEQEAIVQDMEIYEIMHKKLKNADNNAKVTFAPNENLYNQLRVLCNERENIKARIKRNGTVVFTGYIRKTLAIEKRLQLEPLKIELISPSYLLKRKVNQTLIYNQKTVSYIAYDLLSKAGVTDIESFSISATIPVLKVLEDKETYFSVLEDLLFEYGYVFDFNADGKFVVRNLTPTIPENPYEFNSGNLRDKVEQKKNEEEFEKVIVQWKDIITLQNAIMFSDTTGAKDGYKCYIELDPGKYLGEKDDGTGKEWYPDLVHEKGKVVYFSNPSLDIVKDAGISVEKFQVENDKILLSIKNTNIYYKQVIKKLDIFAQSVLVEANGDNKTVIINVTGTEKIFEYKAKYIHSKTYADNLASLLVNYYKYSDFTYNFTTQVETHVGDIVIVTEHGIGTNTVRITARKYNPLIEHYRYEAEAIDEYVPAEATTSSTQAGSSSSDYINSIGTIIAQNNVNIIDIKLYQEKTTQPAVPSQNVSYTISTGQLAGLNNGWSVTQPNTGRKPVWVTNYTTAVPLIQDEILISTDKWHEPVKIFVGTPIYLGMVSNIPESSTFSNNRIEGDWCLCTANGKFYKWTGTEWTDNNITTDNKMAALQDLLTIADASDTIAFCQTLVAIDVFAQNIAAKRAFIDTLEAQTLNINGTLKSGNLAANNAKVALQDLKGVKDIKFYGNGTNDLAIGQQGETPGVITVEIIEPYVGDVGYTGGKIFSYAPAREGSSVVLDNKILNYDEVITAVDNFVYGGRDDWRLPTISELQQLIQLNGNSMNEEYYWTSESFDNEHAYVVKKSTNTAEVFPKEIHRFVSGNEVYCSSNDCALIGNKIYTAHSIIYADIGNYLVIASYNIDTNEIICEATRSLSDSHFGTVGNIEYIDNKLYIFPRQSTYPYYNYNEYFVYDVVNKTFEKNYTVFYSQVCATEKDENNIYVATDDGYGITKSIYRFDTKNKTWNIYNNATGYSVYPNYHGMRIYNNKLFIFSQSGFDFNRFLVFDLNTEQLSTIYLPFNLGTYYAELIDNKIYAPDSNSNILLIVNCLDNSYTTVDITTNVASRMCCTHDNEYLYIFGKKNNDCYVEVIRLSDNQYMACKKLPYDAFKYIACLVNDTVIIPDYNASQAYGGGYEIYKKNFLLNTWPVRVNTETRRFRYKLNDGSWINKDIITPNTQYLTDINIKVFWPQIMNHHTGDKWVITQTQMYSLSAKDINGVEYIKAYDGTLEVKTLKVTDGTINVTAVYAP